MTRARKPPLPKLVAIVAFPGVQLLDVSGPLDVFAEANARSGLSLYRQCVVSAEVGDIRSSSGVRLVADTRMEDGNLRNIDTLLVAGAPGAAEARLDESVVGWLRKNAGNARRYGSVCAGAFFLAPTGLLDGRRVTTHWAVADAFARRHPEIELDIDAIHIADGPVRTAAGVTAGLDLALSLVEEDHGRELAMAVASQLVMFFKRPGGQLQFSRKGDAAPVGRAALQEVQRWVAAEPAADHSIAKLAERTGLSERHFARLFHHEIGMTPAQWVEEARVNAARRMLEDGHHAPKQVATLCGFANADTLRRAFARRVGVTPAEYRRRHGGQQ
ncbi:GlxA family transcriptional regulator [Aquabacter sp. CN5-332]|uniref:GlxA family transcriptional regulator n=1 Tax=Aquabacter sp. CN5-332 TaxID=3156608 RepID=UPI0032B60CFA